MYILSSWNEHLARQERCSPIHPPLRGEHGGLADRVQERFGERVSVVAVAVAISQSRRGVRRHVERHGHAYIYDAGGEAVGAYGAFRVRVGVECVTALPDVAPQRRHLLSDVDDRGHGRAHQD